MSKSTKKRTGFAAGSKMAIATTMLAVPMIFQSAPALAQNEKEAQGLKPGKTSSSRSVDMFLKFSTKFHKMPDWYTIAGIGEGHTIYKNSKGEMFYIESKTGDMKFVSSDYFLKIKNESARSGPYIKFEGIKGESKVSIVGVDKSGNVIQKNSKGEMFYLDPKTGDMKLIDEQIK